MRPKKFFPILEMCLPICSDAYPWQGLSTGQWESPQKENAKHYNFFFHYLFVWGSYVPKKGLRWYASIGWYIWFYHVLAMITIAIVSPAFALGGHSLGRPLSKLKKTDLARLMNAWHGGPGEGSNPRIWKCTVFREVHDNCSNIGKVIGVWWTLQSIPLIRSTFVFQVVVKCVNVEQESVEMGILQEPASYYWTTKCKIICLEVLHFSGNEVDIVTSTYKKKTIIAVIVSLC